MAHIDFESSYDGPPIDQSNPRAGRVEWVVMCQDCIETAHSMLPAQRDTAAELRTRIKILETELREVTNYADRLESAVTARPERLPSKPRPKSEPKPRSTRYQPKEPV